MNVNNKGINLNYKPFLKLGLKIDLTNAKLTIEQKKDLFMIVCYLIVSLSNPKNEVTKADIANKIKGMFPDAHLLAVADELIDACSPQSNLFSTDLISIPEAAKKVAEILGFNL